eukprot:scaffold1422_cov142-Isochrysis_galbana.AAC.1
MDDGDVAMAIGGTRPSTPRTPRTRASVASDERSHGNGNEIFTASELKKKFTDFSVARAPHPHQSLPDPFTPPLLSLPPNPSPYHPFREGVLGRDASDITSLTCSPTLIR